MASCSQAEKDARMDSQETHQDAEHHTQYHNTSVARVIRLSPNLKHIQPDTDTHTHTHARTKDTDRDTETDTDADTAVWTALKPCVGRTGAFEAM